VTATAAPTNFNAGTLTGGTWKVTSPGTLRVPFGSSVVTNAANILLDGTAAYFYRDAATTLALNGLTTNAATGSFTIQNGAGFSSAGAFSNAGSVLIGNGSTFVPDGNHTQTAGSTVISGGVLGSSAPPTAVDLQGGSFAGTGTIDGSLTSAGQLSPGSTTGALTVSGSYTQTTTGSLDVDLAGPAASQYSQLAVGGSASLDGALDVTVASGFIPTTGSTFPIVTASSVSGQFATASGLDSGSKFTLETIYDPADVTLLSKAAAAIQITPTSGLVTSQAGGTATFSAVLTLQPTSSVSFGIYSSNTNEGTVSTPQLTFTTANWNVAQTVTITGVDDQMDEGNVAYTILMAPAVSDDPNYNGFQPSNVSVVNQGTVTAGVSVTPASGLVTTSAGGTATFSVVLNSKPAAEVDLGLSSSNTSQGIVSPASLAFTPDNWNQPQTVTVTGVASAQASGNVNYSVVFAPASSADPNYNGLVPASVSLTNVNPVPDLQVANLRVLPATGVQSGDTLLVEWNDANTGTGPVNGSFTDSITVTNTSTGMTLGTGTVSYDEASAGPIAPGASPSQQFMFILPNAAAGTGQIQFTVTTNSGNTIVEGNTSGTASTNNTATVTIAFHPRALSGPHGDQPGRQCALRHAGGRQLRLELGRRQHRQRRDPGRDLVDRCGHHHEHHDGPDAGRCPGPLRRVHKLQRSHSGGRGGSAAVCLHTARRPRRHRPDPVHGRRELEQRRLRVQRRRHGDDQQHRHDHTDIGPRQLPRPSGDQPECRAKLGLAVGRQRDRGLGRHQHRHRRRGQLLGRLTGDREHNDRPDAQDRDDPLRCQCHRQRTPGGGAVGRPAVHLPAPRRRARRGADPVHRHREFHRQLLRVQSRRHRPHE